MLQDIRTLFTPPVFSNNENKTRTARYVHWIAVVFMGVILGYIILSKIFAETLALNFFDGILFAVFLIIYSIWSLSRRGYVRQAGVTLVVILWLAVKGTASFGAGVRDSAFIANFAVLLAAGLLIGWKSAVALSALTIAAGIGMAMAEVQGISPAVLISNSPVLSVLHPEPPPILLTPYKTRPEVSHPRKGQ